MELPGGLSREFTHIDAARTLAQERILLAREHLRGQFHGDREQDVSDLDIIGFGSLARREVTEESDFDYLVLATGLPEDVEAPMRLLMAANELRHTWNVETAQDDGKKEVRGPGASGLFGQAIGAFDLVEQVGLQQDTNHTLTRRLLLLEESVSLFNTDVRERVVEHVLKRYLAAGSTKADKVPRFLLNDVTRYWHTIAVDYQAKARNGPDESGLRYLKLIIPRKVLYAGTVMSLLLCGVEGFHQATVEDLSSQFDRPPLDRLLQGWSAAPQEIQEAMREVLRVVDCFLACSADGGWRTEVETCGPQSQNEAFRRMKAEGDNLQESLEVIFFDWPAISERSRRMLVF